MVTTKRIGRFFRRKKKEFLKTRAEQKAFDTRVSKIAEVAARKERLKQEVRLAVASERIIAGRRLKAFKAKQGKRKGAATGLRTFATDFTQNFQRTFPPAPRGKKRKDPFRNPFES